MNAPVKSWLPAFLICAIAWGSSFLFIEVGLQAFTPSQVALGRVVVGALVLIGMLLFARHRPRFTRRQIGSIAIVALCLSVVPFVLIPMAQEHISSILASLLNATTPLWTAFFVGLLIPTEKASRAQVLGLVVGAIGIAVLLGAWNVDDFPAFGAILMLAATACYGIGSVMSRMLFNRMNETPTALSAVQMVASTVMLAPVVLLASPSATSFELSSQALWAVIALGVFGTSFAYALFYSVVRKAGATTAASVTYVVPVIATALGILVLGEELLWYEPVGAVIVLTGVWLAQRKPKVVQVATEQAAGASA